VGTQRVRTYALGYNKTETVRSRLISVQQFGKDASVDANGVVTPGTSLPAIVLTQTTTQIGYSRTNWGSWSSSPGPTNVDWLRGDFNGDGKDDMAQLLPGSGTNQNCKVDVLLSTGSGFTLQQWTVLNSGSAICPSTLPAAHRFAADV